jgi:hypothetical protein
MAKAINDVLEPVKDRSWNTLVNHHVEIYRIIKGGD